MSQPLIYEVSPGLYIGNRAAASCAQLLAARTISVLVDLCEKTQDANEINHAGVELFTYSVSSHELLDHEFQRTKDRLLIIHEDLKEYRANDCNVLVFCEDGCKKAPLVIGYHMISSGKNYASVINHIEQIYPLESVRGFTNISHKKLLRLHGGAKK